MHDFLEKDFFRKIVKDKRLEALESINISPSELMSLNLGPSCCLRQNSKLEHELIVSIYLRTSYFKEAERVFLYNSTNLEMDMSPITEAAFKQGKKVYMPKVVDKTEGVARMEFIEVFPDSAYENNSGLVEPVGEDYFSPLTVEDKIELVVPGVCFDKKGNRLGYGGSFYDSYINRLGKDNFHITALAYDYQLFESLPVTLFDVPVDLIITDKNYIDLLL